MQTSRHDPADRRGDRVTDAVSRGRSQQNDDDPRSGGTQLALTTLIVAGSVLANLLVHARESLDVDEIFSLRSASMPWRELWTWIAEVDSHPPLFYAELKLWTAIGGDSVVWVRLLPALTALAGLVALWGLSNALKLWPGERLMLVALASLSPLVQYYALDVRMFAQLQTASVLSLWAFVRWIEAPAPSRATTGALFVANTILVFTHLWGWVFVGCEAAYLVAFARRKVPAFALHLALLAILFAPWVVALVTSGRASYTGQIGWISRPGMSAPATFYVSIIGGFPFPHSGVILGLALAGILIALCARAARSREGRSASVWLLGWFAVIPVALTFVLALVLQVSVWAPRSLVVSAVPFLALVAIGACGFADRWGAAVASAVMVWAAGAGVSWAALPHRLDWGQVTAQMLRTADPARGRMPVYTLEPFVWQTLEFYVSKHDELGAFQIEHTDPVALARVDRERFLVVYREPPDPRFPLKVNVERVLMERGYLVDRGAPISHEGATVSVVSARRPRAAADTASDPRIGRTPPPVEAARGRDGLRSSR